MLTRHLPHWSVLLLELTNARHLLIIVQLRYSLALLIGRVLNGFGVVHHALECRLLVLSHLLVLLLYQKLLLRWIHHMSVTSNHIQLSFTHW